MELPNRTQHIDIFGSTGTGKSTLQKDIIISDIKRGDGVLFIDPHGPDTDDVLAAIPDARRNDVLVFDPSDTEFPIGWNVLEGIPTDDIPLVASSYVDTMKDAWDFSSVSTANMDMYIYCITAALIEAKETLLGMPLMLTSQRYRTHVVKQVADPMVKYFWTRFYEPMSKTDKGRQIQSTLNKSFILFSDPRIRNILGQQTSSFQFKDIIKANKVFLARLPQGKLGLGKTKLLGSLLLTQFHLAALSREPGTTFHVHLDELHTFAGHNLELMLSGVRKFNVSLTLVHQHLDQLSHELQSAVLANTATKIAFRLSMKDSEVITKLLPPNNTRSLPYELADGVALWMDASGVDTVVPALVDHERNASAAEKTVERSRWAYGRDRAIVEANLRQFIEKT